MEMSDARRELQRLLERIESIVGEGGRGMGQLGRCGRCGNACRCHSGYGARSSWGVLAAITAVIGIVAVSKAMCRSSD